MTIFGFIITRKPLYSLDEFHRYQLALQAMEKEAASRAADPRRQYEDILHVMREVLVRMLEKM